MADGNPFGCARSAARIARRRRHRRRASVVAFGITLLCATIIAPPRPRLIWNASASARVGLYTIDTYASLAKGDLVAARLPAAFRTLAADRGYLPANVPLIKRIASSAHDEVCADGGTVRVNGGVVAVRLRRDRVGRTLPWWHGCRRLARDEFLLLSDAPASFDGRYFGLSKRSELIGRAEPLWLR